MGDNREAIHSLGNSWAVTVYGGQIVPFILEAFWLILLPVVVVLVDLWFGLHESHREHRPIRFSGAGWKTLRKLMDYYTMITLGYVIGKVLPFSSDLSTIEVCFYFITLPLLFDLSSIGGHILKLHGISINTRKLIIKFITSRVKSKAQNLGEALEDTIKEES